ncbi:UV DNA damage repair endonuclease UvsE [Xylanibacillus composti]|uniref:UV damage endonuclease UvsE n=1 Tax=Xylanibacillus composti TaxID=1572762 RepID=A0A8J4H463_9BACL|nr:UV DNA damage repair endonuclease UvsE [Xylanibacillus composti]MDT9725867.1 UV DNA damage repair endonuclease UvsE [Xylanibacillus composti]GIQ69177.1 UV damage endonuclease UvsE [Xylanibacillus composti]
MIVRFGYVAMSVEVKNASPSKTMTATQFAKLADREAAIRKLERIAAENLHNTLRLLRHNKAHDIKLYRFSSKLIPLIGHEMLADWDPFPQLEESFREVGDYVKENGMRVSFHPDHFTVLSTPREEVLAHSIADLDRHVRMLEAMGLTKEAKCNIHIGGSYGSKDKAMARFAANVKALPARIRERLMFENDDKTFTARETLQACQELGVPMVLDVHHHAVNNEGEDMEELWPAIAATWKETGLPPKIHVSSPRSDKDPRGHADYVNAAELAAALRGIGPHSPELDVMIEAKRKDGALFQLMKDLADFSEAEPVNQASIVWK